MTFYKILITIHVFSAIIGLGPGFVMIYIVTRAKTMTELRHAYYIRNRIHIFVMIGGTLLLLTGIAMGMMQPHLWETVWFTGSLVLFLIALAAGPMVLSPRAKPIKIILAEEKSDVIPPEYFGLADKLFYYERITNVIFFIIIALMVIKPF